MAGIYVITNKINNKQYVGQTTRNSSEKRMKEHIYEKNNILAKAIRKNGLDNFIIKEYKDIRLEWLDWAEQEMISHCNSLVPNGYNIMLGGQDNRIIGPIVSENISKSNKGKLAWNKGIPCSEETKTKMSKSHQERYNKEKI